MSSHDQEFLEKLGSVEGVDAKRRDPRTIKLSGAVEHSHNILKCSGCDKPLLDVMVTHPEKPFTAKYRAECPYCPPDPKGRLSRSFPVVLKGGVVVGLVGDEEVIHTGHTDLDDGQDASFLFHTTLRKPQ